MFVGQPVAESTVAAVTIAAAGCLEHTASSATVLEHSYVAVVDHNLRGR